MIRQTEETDLEAVMGLVQQAKDYFRAHDIPQWNGADGYPGIDQFRKDMALKSSYVMIDEQGTVVLTACIMETPDPHYTYIEDGAWLDDTPYLPIHRICVSNACKGRHLAQQLFAYAEALAKEKGICSLRADTHELNTSMRHALKDFGFVECGRVYMADGGPRIACQKPLVLR